MPYSVVSDVASQFARKASDPYLRLCCASFVAVHDDFITGCMRSELGPRRTDFVSLRGDSISSRRVPSQETMKQSSLPEHPLGLVQLSGLSRWCMTSRVDRFIMNN